ncbi:MAG: hypothetical protein GY863_07260 [bacterium]|nr:hypothetical protein [bacterium]
MTWERIFFKGGQALTISAVFDIIGICLFFLSMNVPMIPGLIFSILFIIANINTVFGILALYGSQMAETGNLGFNGFVVAVTGMLLGISSFFTPFTWFIYYIGLAMLAKANNRARYYPSNNIWFWVCGSLIGLTGIITGIHVLTGFGTVLSCFGRFQLGRSIKARFVQGNR